MNEQNLNSNEPIQSSKNVWITIIAVVITAIIVGSGVYTWQKSNLQSTEQSLLQQITELQNQITNLQEPTQPFDEATNWKTYTNPTFGYSIRCPSTWTTKQGKVLEAGVSEGERNMNIEFYNGNTLMLRILTDYKTKVGDPSLLSLALDVPSPMDKTTVSDVVIHKIGSLDGYRRLVTVSDPVFQGLEYITKDSNYIYHLTTFEKTESTEIVNMLKTFTAK